MDKMAVRTLFKLENSVISQFAFFEENLDAASNINNLNNSLKFSIDKDRRVVIASAGIIFDQGRGPVVKCVLDLEFKIREDSFLNLMDKNNIVIPKELLIYFGSKTIGALRGVLLAKLENTPINIMLPLVNLEDMIEESFIAKL